MNKRGSNVGDYDEVTADEDVDTDVEIAEQEEMRRILSEQLKRRGYKPEECK